MVRTLLSVVALVGLAAVLPGAHASQSKAPASSAVKPAVAGPVNINTASAAELVALPGIGARTAGRIVEYRQKNGPFKKIEKLMNVRGVGEKNFLKLKEQITVTATKPGVAQQQQ